MRDSVLAPIHRGVESVIRKNVSKLRVTLLALAALTWHQAAEAQTVPVTAEFWPVELSWTGQFAQTTYKGLWTAYLDKSGVLVVCGAGQLLDASRATPTQKWMESVYVQLGERKVLKDISFFTKVKSTEPLNKAQATCRSTGKKPQKGETTMGMGWPPGQARF